MELIKDTKKLNTAIKSIGTRGKQLDGDIHLAAVSCLYHAEQFGDHTLITRLVNAMPNSGRPKALVRWVEDFSLLSFDKETKAFKITSSKKKVWNIEGASEMPFWEYLPEKDIAELSIDALVKFVVGKIEKASDNGKLKDGFTMQGFKTKLAKGLKEVSI